MLYIYIFLAAITSFWQNDGNYLIERINSGLLARVAIVLYVDTNRGPLPVPLEPKEHIGMLINKSIHPITSLADFSGKVYIRNKEDAVSFVRLRTSPALWYAWRGESIVEVVRREDASKLPRFGLINSIYTQVPSGFMGIVSSQTWQNLGFSPVKVSYDGNRYHIKRWLMVENAGTAKIEYVEEIVSQRGDYTIRPIKELPELESNKVDWTVETFE